MSQIDQLLVKIRSSPDGCLPRTFLHFYNYFVKENHLEKYYEEKVINRLKYNNFGLKQLFVWLTFNFTFSLFKKMSLDDDRCLCSNNNIKGG